MGDAGIGWTRTDFENCSIVRPRGELTGVTYRRLRDDLVKYAVDQPRAVIVAVDDLVIPADPLLTAFTSAWMRIDTWPTVPLLLVAQSEQQRERFRSSCVDRFLPVFATVAAALDSLVEQPSRRRTSLSLARSPACGRRARRFVTETCERWSIPELRGDACLVATELVENSLIHANSHDDMEIRLELRRNLLTVAVSDSDPREAVLREPGPGADFSGGLHVVAEITRAWGCAPRWPQGKVVWATLRTKELRGGGR
ncbi:ATP-binding protein [Nocardia wallacei]|uniref:ATP-binding protein n=1 Tax=Nocardia wallacei TaxID=480035 RepID=UPI0024551378|nr:ATP-binding protein [Nocardia wallacei]